MRSERKRVSKVFTNIIAEVKKVKESFDFIRREERAALHGKKGGDPIFRMVEAERCHANILRIIPSSIILFLIEAFGMLWALTNKIKFDYAIGFFVSFLCFTGAAAVFICIIEKKLSDPDFSSKQKRTLYMSFWLVYCVAAMSFSIMELLDRGTINNYMSFIFIFTVMPVIEPLPKTVLLIVTLTAEGLVMLKSNEYNPDVMLVCFVSVIIASASSYAIFFKFMNSRITEKRLEHFANGDQLTMLTNRRGFNSLAPELKRYCGKKSLKMLVIMADIDDFKQYNDTYGHVEGDICIKNVAAKIRENFSRPTDICARYGGEEFVVLSTVRDDEKLLEHIKELLADVENTVDKSGRGVTVSIGVCISENPSKAELGDLIKIADKELYNAKANGKNCISYKGKIYKN